jgi:hypothetical protein
MIGRPYCPSTDQIVWAALPLAAPFAALGILLAINLLT